MLMNWLYRKCTSFFFFLVHPLIRFGNCQSQSRMENDKECMMHKTLLHFISIHTWANRRYSVAESQTSHWINQADLHIPSMNIYSFLFAILLVWSLVFWNCRYFKCVSTEWAHWTVPVLCGIKFLMEFTCIDDGIHFNSLIRSIIEVEYRCFLCIPNCNSILSFALLIEI